MRCSALCSVLLSCSIFGAASLKCYHCNSTNIDKIPKCDRIYWKQMDSTERDNLIIDCPIKMSSFCVVVKNTTKREGLKKPVIETVRGCFGEKDMAGTKVHAGCVTSAVGEEICMCSDNLCNAGHRMGTIATIATLLVAVTFLRSQF